jgi:hypothetical protein
MLMVAGVSVLLVAVLAPQASCIGLYGSYWHSDDLGDGYGFGGKWNLQFIPLIGADVRATYINFSDSSAYCVPLEASVFLNLWLIYGGGGVGYYIFGADEVDIKNTTGGFLLLGGKLALGGYGLFGELQYRFAGTDLDNVSVPTKLKSDGIGLNAGVLINW